jgi:hypothetical protein
MGAEGARQPCAVAGVEEFIVPTAAADTHACTRIGLQPELPLAAIDPSSVRLADRVDQAGSIVATLT